jgi:hypothetical protein
MVGKLQDFLSKSSSTDERRNLSDAKVPGHYRKGLTPEDPVRSESGPQSFPPTSDAWLPHFVADSDGNWKLHIFWYRSSDSKWCISLRAVECFSAYEIKGPKYQLHYVAHLQGEEENYYDLSFDQCTPKYGAKEWVGKSTEWMDFGEGAAKGYELWKNRFICGYNNNMAKINQEIKTVGFNPWECTGRHRRDYAKMGLADENGYLEEKYKVLRPESPRSAKRKKKGKGTPQPNIEDLQGEADYADSDGDELQNTPTPRKKHKKSVTGGPGTPAASSTGSSGKVKKGSKPHATRAPKEKTKKGRKKTKKAKKGQKKRLKKAGVRKELWDNSDVSDDSDDN